VSEYKFPRGSEWRKWDLHVHTPYSALNNGFGNNFEEYAKILLQRAIERQVAAIGITDYFSVEGYKVLRQLLQDPARLKKLLGDDAADKARKILVLPNVELRTSVIITRPDGSDSRVNFHVIFDDSLDAQVVDEHFLRDLRFTAESNPSSPDERWSLTVSNLEDLGKRLKQQHENFRLRSDLYIGMMNAVVSHEDVTAVLERQASRFQGHYLIAVEADEDLSECSWDGQGHQTRKLFIQKAHVLFSANPGTREFALGRKHDTTDAFLDEFKTLKPCVHGSDAHAFDELFVPAEDRHTWIKSDPTFLGLRQVLNEPDDRVFIGLMPPGLQRLADHPTRVISQVEIKRRQDARTADKWFDTSLPLNPGLVAIIGNKGGGKSALSDVLGLLGNTPRYASFSFLTGDKFRSPRNNLARQFWATMTWADATQENAPSLADNPETGAVEKVKYIPQNYLEEICNEIESGKGSRFYAELEQVIFSYVPAADRLGFQTLDRLLDYRSEEADKAVKLLVNDLESLNSQIVDYEERLSSRFRRALDAQLAEKRRELQAHDETKPADVSKPEEDAEVQQETREAAAAIETKQAELDALIAKIAENQETDARLARRQSAAEKLAAKLDNLRGQVASALEDAKVEFAELGLDPTRLVSFAIDSDPIDQALKTVEAERVAIRNQLDAQIEGSLEHQHATVVAEIADLRTLLSAPQRQYQSYLKSLEEWAASRARIVGTESEPGSISFLEKEIRDIGQLPQILKGLRRARNRKILEIFRQKQVLRSYYAKCYGTVQTFLREHPIASREGFRFTFNASIAETGFAENFLALVNQRRIGPFAGVEEGGAELKKLLDAANFDSALGMLHYIRTLLEKMTQHEGRILEIKDQLTQGTTLKKLYNMVFSLDYLSPIYNLRWDGKVLERLSPGERGNLLLIFYLLVDQNDIPLIIDQPEENLDNQTVFHTLVPCIKDAEKRRQIVMVTHNPNIAVVCDAEQIIHAEIDKNRGNEVLYQSGSLEDPVINKDVVDVLEGTRPAFDQRDSVYFRDS
jgi:ABC-type lipoprotein export system ATPase subunit